MLPTGSTVYVLGGPAALSPTVDAQLRGLGYQVTRASGASRFDTAVAIAHLLGDPTVIFDSPQPAPDGQGLLLPLRDKTHGPAWTKSPVDLTFLTPDGAFDLKARLAQP